jgi:hypothetical protein
MGSVAYADIVAHRVFMDRSRAFIKDFSAFKEHSDAKLQRSLFLHG